MKDTRTFQEVFAALGQIQWKIVTVGEHLTGGPLVNACSYLKIPASEKVFAELKLHFRPEFLNRLDEMILFKPLTKPVTLGIAQLIIDDVSKTN